ncbi:MAG: efflux RND transporter periplasmic adaptor subunit [Bryobacteraceae bacterium]
MVTIPADAIERMGLTFAQVATDLARTEIRVPGTVAPDGYRDVPVSSVVGGIATEITAELGQSVKRGQKIAQLFSRELAEAQTALIGYEAELEVEHKKLTRVEELVRLGAASREELESVEAAHRLHAAHVQEARQKLLFLGLTREQVGRVSQGRQVSSDVMIPAPIDGVVIARKLNLGQVVNASQELFTVTDLSSVWIEGSLLENDFASVRAGSRAMITTPAYPDRKYSGAVDYIDPRVDPQTRTATVRVIVPNRDFVLRLGMYADVTFTSVAGSRAPVVPAKAVQQIGPNSVVYIPVDGEANRFVQRSITLGEETPTGRQVLAGLRAGERVITEGSFLLRAEALRQHPQ